MPFADPVAARPQPSSPNVPVYELPRMSPSTLKLAQNLAFALRVTIPRTHDKSWKKRSKVL